MAELQDPWIGADPSGQWVRYSEYDALEAKLAALSAENERLRKALEGIDSIITNSINENGSDYHRVKIGEEWYDGPVVDVPHKILMGLREIARTALKEANDERDK